MQSYPDPYKVSVPEGTPNPSKKLKKVLEREGQIVPLLVTPDLEAADKWQGERVLALRELGFPTILVEDSWEKEDLW